MGLANFLDSDSFSAICSYPAFLDAQASLKTMFKIKSVIDVFKVMRFQEYYRVLKSITEFFRVLQSTIE